MARAEIASLIGGVGAPPALARNTRGDPGVLPSMFKFLVVAIASTSLVSGCAGGGVQPVVAELEVFNRTVEDLLYVAADDEVLEVPACGSASDPTFRVDVVSVRAAGGYVRGFGGDFTNIGPQGLVLVEVAHAADSGLPEPMPPPDPLPPCEGHPEAQRGT